MAVKKEIPFKLEKETKKVGAKVLPKTNKQKLEEIDKGFIALKAQAEDFEAKAKQSRENMLILRGKYSAIAEIVKEEAK